MEGTIPAARRLIIPILSVVTFMLLFSACDITGEDVLEKNSFNIYLWGTWEASLSASEGDVITLEIENDTIRVTGPGTHPVLNGITRGPLQNGYSEQTENISIATKKGILYITDMVNDEIIIPYHYQQDAGTQKWLNLGTAPQVLTLQLQEEP